MTDTTKPPKQPTSSRPRPFGRDGKTSSRSGDEGHRDAGRRDAGRRDPAAKTRGVEPSPPKDDARIAKVMARAGLCSRRDAEGWIAAGRVAVNGAVIDSPALNVKPGDRITVDGEPLPERERTRLVLFHKPRGLVTTARDPEGRPTIFDHLPEGLPRLVSVGRLDINTEGLMLLTNDGGLARVLELPATGWLRRYRVRANGVIDQARLDALKGGVTIDDVNYAGIEATLDRVQGANVWLTMGLREGKNREIKRVLEALGLAVTRLIRVSFGPFQLGELAEGAVETVPSRVLRDQLGPVLAAQAGVDLEAREEPAGRRSAPGADGSAPPRPRRSEPEAPRPHVAAMRAAREEAAGDGRKRIERGATADRKGRSVTIERVVPVGSPSGRAAESRNARRFATEKREFVAGRQKTRGEAGASKRGPAGATRPRRDDDARPARAGFGDRPRGERAAGFDGKPRGERTAGFGDKPRGERTAGFGDKPRGERTAGFGDKPRGERTAGFGDKPRGERTAGFGDKPRGGKPNGRVGGFGAERPATGRNKPAGGGGRPGGRRPDGGKPPRSRP